MKETLIEFVRRNFTYSLNDEEKIINFINEKNRERILRGIHSAIAPMDANKKPILIFNGSKVEVTFIIPIEANNYYVAKIGERLLKSKDVSKGTVEKYTHGSMYLMVHYTNNVVFKCSNDTVLFNLLN